MAEACVPWLLHASLEGLVLIGHMSQIILESLSCRTAIMDLTSRASVIWVGFLVIE